MCFSWWVLFPESGQGSASVMISQIKCKVWNQWHLVVWDFMRMCHGLSCGSYDFYEYLQVELGGAYGVIISMAGWRVCLHPRCVSLLLSGVRSAMVPCVYLQVDLASMYALVSVDLGLSCIMVITVHKTYSNQLRSWCIAKSLLSSSNIWLCHGEKLPQIYSFVFTLWRNKSCCWLIQQFLNASASETHYEQD